MLITTANFLYNLYKKLLCFGMVFSKKAKTT